jgi:hypothetical protein
MVDVEALNTSMEIKIVDERKFKQVELEDISPHLCRQEGGPIVDHRTIVLIIQLNLTLPSTYYSRHLHYINLP